MAEAASHRSYNALLASRVYSRLRMRQTYLPAGPQIRTPNMRGYDLNSPKPPSDVTTLVSVAFSWASNGMISMPADLNRSRGYAGARLVSRAVQAKQLRLVRGSSGPPGRGQNFAGLAIFRYRTRCGTVYGHTGNTLGHKQFMASTLVRQAIDRRVGDRADQLQITTAPARGLRALRQSEEDAVCAALR